MARNEIGGGGGAGHSKSGDSFIDRSNVRILLCDNDSKSSDEVFTLLCRCSYQGKPFFSFVLGYILNLEFLFLVCE